MDPELCCCGHKSQDHEDGGTGPCLIYGCDCYAFGGRGYERVRAVSSEREIMLLTRDNVPRARIWVLTVNGEVPEVVLAWDGAYVRAQGVTYDVPGRTANAEKHLPCYREATVTGTGDWRE